MTKILVLANNDVGLYKFRKELLQELLHQNFNVYISLPYGELVEPLIEMGCKYIDTPIDRRGTNLVNDLKLLKAYYRVIKEIKPDVVLTYTIKPNIYGGIISRITKTLYMPNITGLGTAIVNDGFLQKILLFLYRLVLKNAICIFFQNSSNLKFFREKKVVGSNYKLIPGSGINLSEYKYEDYPPNDNLIRFIFIGRIMKDKGVNELFEAAIEIKEKYPNTRFEFVGDYEEDYSEKIQELVDSEIIKYHGRQNNVHSFIKESHATILPSYHEGTSNVLLETASTGRPVLASDVPGCRETFDEGISGYGFKAKDIDSLVNAIIKFVNLSYKEKKEMGIAGRQKMELEYNRKIVIDAYLNEINKCKKMDNWRK